MEAITCINIFSRYKKRSKILIKYRICKKQVLHDNLNQDQAFETLHQLKNNGEPSKDGNDKPYFIEEYDTDPIKLSKRLGEEPSILDIYSR